MWWAQYYDNPVDYSKEFDERVGRLADELRGALGVDPRHETDMNYNAGQRVSVLLTGDGVPTEDPAAAGYRLTIVVSSRGPVWARMAWRKGTNAREWFPATAEEAAPAGGKVMDAVATVMTAAGLRQVPDDVLDDELQGRVTEMDELPATVRDVLFCEVC